MASNKSVTFGPIAIATTNGTLFKPGTTTGSTNAPEGTTALQYTFIHLRVTNRTAAAITFGLFLESNTNGTAGREIIWAATATGGPPPTTITASTGQSVAAGSFVEWFGRIRVNNGDTNNLLNGIASATGLVIEGEGEVGIS